MNFCLRKLSVAATILVPFIEVTTGSAAGAIVFWLTLFWAAATNERRSKADPGCPPFLRGECEGSRFLSFHQHETPRPKFSPP
jgi:hypothetical protein